MLFCRYCGEKLPDDSMFCSFCGKKLIAKEQNDPVETTKETATDSASTFKSDPEFVWNLSGFPQPKKTEEIALEWQDALKATHKSTPESLEISKSLDEQEILHSLKIEPKLTPEKKITFEEIKQEIEMAESKLSFGEEAELNYGERIDKFYTFNKKNEEFQKLLDKEYERTRSKEKELSSWVESNEEEIENIEAYVAPVVIPEVPADVASVVTPEETETVTLDAASEEGAEVEKVAESASAEVNENLIFDNDTLSKKFDTKELNSDLIEAALERAGIKVARDFAVTEGILESEMQTLSPGDTEALQEMSESLGQSSTYKSDFTPRFVFDAEDEIESFTPIPTQGESQVVPEEAQQEAQLAAEVPQSVQQAAQALSAALKMQRTPIAHEEPEPQPEIIPEPQFVQPEPQEIDPELEKQEAFKKLEQMWDSEPEKKSGSKDFLKSDDNDEDEDVQKKGKVSTIIIAVLAVVLTCQLAVLGIIHAMPESRAATFINNELGFAVTWFDNIFGGGEQNSGEDDNSGVPPEADKRTLISHQLHHNINIHHIEPLTNPGFVSTRQYDDDRITQSVPISDNLWRMEGDEAMHYDQEIVALIIKFNTRWIDYINHSSASVLEVVMPGSLMEQSLRRFDQFGEVNKTFLLLQIGDIRQYENTFFVWTFEEIQSISVAGIETIQQSRIYEIEVIGDKMYITRYFEE